MSGDFSFKKEVRSLASSRGTSNGPDWRDVGSAQVSYQKFTGVLFVIELTASEGAKQPDLIVTAHAYEKGSRGMGARPLVSVSVSCRSQDYTHLESAVMKAMFDLDVALYAGNYVT